VAEAGVAARIWYGESRAARAARTVLAPAAALYGTVAAARSALYAAGVFRTHAGSVPVVSIGNLTVGGTGKTPAAAWLAAELAARGGHPAVVLRGYGGDEPLVHRRLNPSVPVLIDADRVAAIARAAAEGADIVVLDDAFQHRRAARAADIVLVSADRWPARARLLPAGPFREPPSALARATLVIITVKAADEGEVARVRTAVTAAAPAVPVSVMRLGLGVLSSDSAGAPRPLESVRGGALFAISAIGDPAAFAAQLEASGARVRAHAFPDHHAFTAADAASLAARLAPGETPLCTLKDYVKLAPLWPRQAPALWYVSQRPVVEEGRAALDALIASLLRARIAEL
jgi:tetraacyldisaccharide 4'-kinase